MPNTYSLNRIIRNVLWTLMMIGSPTLASIKELELMRSVPMHRVSSGGLDVVSCTERANSPFPSLSTLAWRDCALEGAEAALVSLMLFLLVGCLRPGNMLVNLRDGSAQTVERAATLR